MTNKQMHMAMEALCPMGTDEGVDEFLEDFFESIPLFFGIGTRILLMFFWYGPIIILGKFKTLGRLKVEDKQRYLNWWASRRFVLLRDVFDALKTLGLLARVGKEWEPS